jgi:hypothetical protein
MHRSLQRPIRLATTLALLSLVALGSSPASLASYSGGPDRFDTASLEAGRTTSTAVSPATDGYAGGPGRTRGTLADYELDPAIRFAIAARATDPTPVPARVAEPIAAPDNGFAWSAAALGLALGALGMCLVLGCVTLIRHDGRLRNA